MIIEQKDQDVHNITESNITESNITEFIAFCKFVSLKNTLLNYCKFKTQGFHVFDIFKVLFLPYSSYAISGAFPSRIILQYHLLVTLLYVDTA